MGISISKLFGGSSRGRDQTRLPIGDLPRDVLLRLAQKLRETTDILSLRAASKGARAALDGPAFRHLARVVVDEGGLPEPDQAQGLLEEVQRYEGLLSLSVAAAYIEAAGTNTSEGLRRAACSPRTSVGLWVESAWVLNLHATFPRVSPGAYVLEAMVMLGCFASPITVEASWGTGHISSIFDPEEPDVLEMHEGHFMTVRLLGPFGITGTSPPALQKVTCSFKNTDNHCLKCGMFLESLRLGRSDAPL